MKGRSALPRAAFILGLVAVAAGIAGTLWGRGLLAKINFFDVRRVEVVGARWVAPDELLRLAAIGREQSVWEDYDVVERRLTGHPLIEEAQVHRAGLRALRIVVRETEPLAFVGIPELRAVHADGKLLPIDPRNTALDLPLLTMDAELAEDSARLAEGPALSALAVFAKLQELDPGLAAVVSDFSLSDEHGLEMNLIASQPARRLALPGVVDAKLAERVRATLADLRQRGVVAESLEGRYANIIVVRREQT